eukprot:Gb_11704 [translate_table: standard]
MQRPLPYITIDGYMHTPLLTCAFNNLAYIDLTLGLFPCAARLLGGSFGHQTDLALLEVQGRLISACIGIDCWISRLAVSSLGISHILKAGRILIIIVMQQQRQLRFMGEALQKEMAEGTRSPVRIAPRKQAKTWQPICQEVASNVDMLNEIFKYLDATSLARASCVSKKWKQATDDEALWEAICTQHWPTTASHTGQLKSVVVALGGFRRLYVNCLHPLLSRNRQGLHPLALKAAATSSREKKWSKDEVYLSLSLFSIDCYERIAPQTSHSSPMGFLCKTWADQQHPSNSTRFTSDVKRLLEGWRDKCTDPPAPIKPSIDGDVCYSWGSTDAQSST